MLTAERLREALHYDPETGVFTWVKPAGLKMKPGQIAGCVGKNGYRSIRIDRTLHTAHRLAWLYVHATWPTQLDHMNGRRADNWIANLRDVPQSMNAQNIRRAPKGKKYSQLLGACWCKYWQVWHSKIRVDGKSRSLGRFPNETEAHEAYLSAKRRLHEGCTI